MLCSLNHGSRCSPAIFNLRQAKQNTRNEIASHSRYQDVYAKLLDEMKWRRLVALTEDGMKYTKYITNMDSMLKDRKIIDSLVNKKFSREANKEDQLKKFKDVS